MILTFNGINLGETYSCEFFREDSDTSPARDMDFISVPGRSGSLILDNNKFPNVEMEYTAVFYDENADANAVLLKNYLLSLAGYKRLTDSEHPDEYYMAVVSKKIAPKITRERELVKLGITFNRKPQRWLLSGDTEYSTLNGTVTGNPIYTDTSSVDPTSVSVNISIPYENGAMNYTDVQNYATGLKISVDDNVVWQRNYVGSMVIEASIDVGISGTITKCLKQCPPSSEWLKDPNYGRVYYAPFDPEGTIVAATFWKFRGNTSTKFLGFLTYDPTVHRLYYMDSQEDLTEFRARYDRWAMQCVVVETSDSVSGGSQLSLPDGEKITASLNARFLIPSGDTSIISADVTGIDTLVNPTPFPSKPLIRIYGNGVATINGETITVSDSDVYVDVDCDIMDCYEGDTNRNGDVVFSTYDFPELQVGENTFLGGTGITGFLVIPRWWMV